MGLVVGGALASAAREGLRSANLMVSLSPTLLAVTAVVMCALAAVLSIARVLRLDPAAVFKG